MEGSSQREKRQRMEWGDAAGTLVWYGHNAAFVPIWAGILPTACAYFGVDPKTHAVFMEEGRYTLQRHTAE